MCPFNIRSWNSYLEHFSSGKIYSSYSSLFCFTETNINDSPAKHIDGILDDWKDIHKNTQYGLALCYNRNKVNIVEVIEVPSVLQVLPIVLEKEKETFIIGNSVLSRADSGLVKLVVMTNVFFNSQQNKIKLNQFVIFRP